MYIPWATASGVTEQDRAPDTDDYYKVITMDTNDLFSFAYQITCGMVGACILNKIIHNIIIIKLFLH